MNKKYRRHNIKLPVIHCLYVLWLQIFCVFHSTILIEYMYCTQSGTATFFPPVKCEFFMYS